MADIKIGANTYNCIETLRFPLSDGSGFASFVQGKGFEELVEFSQVNPVVASYMENVTYSPDDYTVSNVGEYASQETSYNKYQPSGYNVEMAKGYVQIADSNNGTMIEEVPEGITTIYNIVPETGGIYVNVDENGNAIKSGKLIPTGSLRMLYVDGIKNVRDLGGWACDGGTVKYGKIIRGTTMNGTYTITESGKNVLRNLIKIDHEIDFRDFEEWQGTESALGSDVKYSQIPYGMYNGAISAEIWQTAFVKIFREILESVKNGEPLYIHCESGMDRCGTVCFLLESILGLSQSDIDKDYELSSFFTYTSASILKERNNQYYVAMITDVHKYSGNTHRDKVVNYLLTLGISIDEINAFREAMIEGTPEILSTTVDTYSITNTLNNVTSDNGNNLVDEYQPYMANIKVPTGYVIESVSVTMGGKDITGQVWSGTRTNLNRTVLFNLLGCKLSNTKKVVQDGQIYGSFVNAQEGYTLDGATVEIKMGGVNVSTYYKDGAIIIPKVTGDIEISITAVSTAVAYTNLADPTSADWKDGYRISGGVEVAKEGSTVSNKIPCTKNDVIRITGATLRENSDRILIGIVTVSGTAGNVEGYYNLGIISGDMTMVTFDGIENDVYKFTVTDEYAGGVEWIRFVMATPEDASKVIITVNEEI